MADRLAVARRRAGGSRAWSIASGSICLAAELSRLRKTSAFPVPGRRTASCSNGSPASFVADGRRLKPLIKLLVTSTVYRQVRRASRRRERRCDVGVKVDPSNQLLWRMPLKRLEAEIVRDAILAAGGSSTRRSAVRRCGRESGPMAPS